jgi:hypothetical protein
MTCAVASTLVFAFCVPASADEDPEDPRWDFHGWRPSISAAMGVHGTDVEGFVVSKDSMGQDIRPSDARTDYAVTPLAQFTVGVETPEIPRVPGRISFFANFDFLLMFPIERNVASEGSPTGFEIESQAPNIPEGLIEGQGSQTTVATELPAYGATGGISLPVNVGDWLSFDLRAGVSWMRYRWEIDGVVLEAIKPSSIGRDFRAVELRAHGTLDSEGVGPYLGIQFQPYELGPFQASAFIDAAYYRLLSDREIILTDTMQSTDNLPPPETYTAIWGFRVGDDFWRATAGVRFYLSTR